jgi:hypothetical protein
MRRRKPSLSPSPEGEVPHGATMNDEPANPMPVALKNLRGALDEFEAALRAGDKKLATALIEDLRYGVIYVRDALEAAP